MGLFESGSKSEPEGYIKNEERLFDGFGGFTKSLITGFSFFISLGTLCCVY